MQNMIYFNQKIGLVSQQQQQKRQTRGHMDCLFLITIISLFLGDRQARKSKERLRVFAPCLCWCGQPGWQPGSLLGGEGLAGKAGDNPTSPCAVYFPMFPCLCLPKRPRGADQGALKGLHRACWVWACIALPLGPLTPARRPPQPFLACLLKHWGRLKSFMWWRRKPRSFADSPAVAICFCCHGYNNEAITLFRISYFYCNYTTGNY